MQVELKSVEDHNLLIFGVMSLSDRFLSIQGGAAVVSSYFGGQYTIFVRAGNELSSGDFIYFHRFSNASMEWTNRNKTYSWEYCVKNMGEVKERLTEDLHLIKRKPKKNF